MALIPTQDPYIILADIGNGPVNLRVQPNNDSNNTVSLVAILSSGPDATPGSVLIGSSDNAFAQQTSTGTATQIAAARPTRRSVLFKNTATSGSVWIGKAGVTTSTGLELKPGESCPFTCVNAFFVIDNASTHCVVAVADEF